MGEVYRARDPRLNRDVAIKFLPPRGDKARFQTEARALAALNHPNIVAIYDVGENYIVTELVDGAPMKATGMRQAIELAAQTADGLAAAHGIGIYHRDIKPANILVTREGRVKIIDFGLAKDSEHADGAETLTAVGSVMGTAAYMSPEQVRGQKLDARSDLFSLGVVLYEQVAGRRPFQGEGVAQTMALILEREPEDLPENLPASLKQIVHRCLAKERAARFQSAGDLAFALRGIGAGSTTGHASIVVEAPAAKSGSTQLRLWQAIAAIGLIGTGIAAWAPWRTPPEPPPMTRLVVESPGELANSNNAGSAISPDGKKLAFVALAGGRPTLHIRPLDSLEARAIPESSGAGRPFWSPDSKSVAYFGQGKLMRADLDGGATQSICNTDGSGRGGTWNRDNVILYSTGGSSGFLVRRVPASGGESTVITEFDASRKEDAHYYPQFLPDGKRFIYIRRSADREKSGIYIGSLDDPEKGRKDQLILRSSHRAVYSPDPRTGKGHLLFIRGNGLYAQSFDPGSSALSGEPRLIGQDAFLVTANAFSDVSASAAGIVTYSTGNEQERILNRRDRSGKITGEPQPFSPATTSGVVSRDGKKLVVSRADPQIGDSLWITDLERNLNTRLYFESAAVSPILSPDGSKVAFNARNKIYVMSADGSGKAELLLESKHSSFLTDWTADGKHLILSQTQGDSSGDVFALPLAGDRKLIPLVQTKFRDFGGAVSPDGRWLAYTSSETGRPEVYVQAFPQASGKWLVSDGGGFAGAWTPDGKELIYSSETLQLYAVPIQPSGKGISAGKPSALFKISSPNFFTNGKLFLTMDSKEGEAKRPVVVLMNWQRP
jgi:serine/threonine protein kinase